MHINIIDRNQVLDSFVQVAREAGHYVEEHDPQDTEPITKGDVIVAWDDAPQYRRAADRIKRRLFCMQHGMWGGIVFKALGRKPEADRYLVFDEFDKSMFIDGGCRYVDIVGYPWWEVEPDKPEGNLPDNFLLYVPRHGRKQTWTDLQPEIELQFFWQAARLAEVHGLQLVTKVMGGNHCYPQLGSFVVSHHGRDPKRLPNMLWLLKNAKQIYMPIEQSATKMVELMPQADYYLKEKPTAKAILKAVCG